MVKKMFFLFSLTIGSYLFSDQSPYEDMKQFQVLGEKFRTGTLQFACIKKYYEETSAKIKGDALKELWTALQVRSHLLDLQLGLSSAGNLTESLDKRIAAELVTLNAVIKNNKNKDVPATGCMSCLEFFTLPHTGNLEKVSCGAYLEASEQDFMNKMTK